MRRIIPLIAAAILGSVITLSAYQLWFNRSNNGYSHNFPEFSNNARFASLSQNTSGEVDLTIAAEKSVAAVVHIKSTSIVAQKSFNSPYADPFRDFFGDDFFYGQPQQREQRQESSGSGVIYSPDGYIVTNNHVINGAEEVMVILNDKREYKAKVIGADPSTDIAVLKIEQTELHYMPFANSNEVRVGEWVLAVGNPFNLSSTVTAGIVSAKGRSINILQDKSAIESFIQTDAAVNPGNSGGALVNLKGELIGINTAIATPTGVYAGYSFAVPSNIVAKVIKDLREFGMVQRGYLGVTIREVNGELAKALNLSVSEGVYVDSLVNNSSAQEAGIKHGDIITKVDNTAVKSVPDLMGEIGSKRPGDKVKITYIRGGKENTVDVVLKNKEGKSDMTKKSDTSMLDKLGVELEQVTDAKLMRRMNIDGGVQIKKLLKGKLSSQTNVKEGFIITKINNRNINTVEDVSKALSSYKGGVMMEGVYPNFPGVYYYAFGI